MDNPAWELLGNLPAEIVAGVGLAVAICKVAAQLLRLIPPDETNRVAYRHLRYGIIAATALLTLAVLAIAVGLYLVRAFSGPLPTPV